MKVVKFGGSSLADVQEITLAKNIILADSARTFIVVSAPGRCAKFSRKITDLLIDAHAELEFADVSESLNTVLSRFSDISVQLNINMDKELTRTREDILINKKSYDFVISRGEYLMALLFSKLLGCRFLDAANYIVIKRNGEVNLPATQCKIQNAKGKAHERFVLGGFYGQSENGGVKTFARGGSDYSGAIAAVCLGAELYENFTDTCGVQTANPALVKNTKTVAELDYKTMHKLSLAGASVIYPNCIPLLRSHSTPLKVDCTFDIGKNYTLISHKKPSARYFSITYKTMQNISKNTAEILCVFNKIYLNPNVLKNILKDIEVYLVKFELTSFVLLCPQENLQLVINKLHEHMLQIKN